jgi:hypothetical protein
LLKGRKDKWGHILCEHNKQKRHCRDCGLGSFCEHLRFRSSCADCSPVGVYKRYLYSARDRNLVFSLNFNEYDVLSKMPCSYCGNTSTRNGIDRKDNSVGYTSENSVPCCSKCNFMKHKYTVEEFLEHAKRIVEYSTKGK